MAMQRVSVSAVRPNDVLFHMDREDDRIVVIDRMPRAARAEARFRIRLPNGDQAIWTISSLRAQGYTQLFRPSGVGEMPVGEL